jgi:hypothetical protein
MNRNAFAAVVLALGLSTALAAQQPPPTQPPAQPPPASQPSTAAAQSVTLEGCLVQEKAPAGAPTPAEKPGAMEDFILTNARVKSPGSGSPTAEQPTGTSGARGSTYGVKGLEAKRLQEFVGQRVEIVGKLDQKASPAGGAPELQASSIKKIEGTCPPAK